MSDYDPDYGDGPQEPPRQIEQPQPTPAAIVVRFTANGAADPQAILQAFEVALGDDHRQAEAWLCIKDSLDTLNETLTALGWPPHA